MSDTLDPKTTALILIDLQRGIVGRPGLAPHAGADVVKRGATLARAFRERGGTVFYVRVDLANTLQLPVDRPVREPGTPPPPAEASELVPEAGYDAARDVLITKRQWGAFFGTDLENELHDHRVKTVVVAGIATNFGVESTVRASQGLGFATVVVEDACASRNDELHRFAIEQILPQIARVRSTEQVLAMLGVSPPGAVGG